jgi:hypothetical protein
VLAQEDVYQVEYDGASKRNPGRAGAGALVRHPDGSVVSKFFLPFSFHNKKYMVAEERKRGGLPGDFMANACSLFQCHFVILHIIVLLFVHRCVS